MNIWRQAVKFTERHLILLPVLSALLLTTAFSVSFLWPLVLVAFFPIFVFIEKSQGLWKTIKGFWIFGLIYFGIVLSWFFAVLPFDWLGVENYFLGAVAIFFIWSFSVFALSLPFALLGYAFISLPLKWRVPIFPVFWIVAEFLAAFCFGLVWMGQNGAIGPNWAFGAIGFIASVFSPLLKLAGYFGLWGISGFIVSVAVIVYLLYVKRKKTALVMLGIVLGILTICVVLNLTLQRKQNDILKKNIAVVQTYSVYNAGIFSGGFSSKTAGQAISLKDRVPKEADVIFLPEGSFYIPEEFAKHQAEFIDLIPQETSRVIGVLHSSNGKPDSVRVVSLSIDGEQKILGEKILLMPFGEYLPYLVEWGFKNWKPREFELYKYEHPFLSGVNDYNGRSSEAVLICSAMFSPNAWEDLASRGAKILALSASQWHFDSSFFLEQAERAIRLFAAETDRYFVKAANGGYSYIIDNKGKMIAKSSSPQSLEVLSGEAEYRASQTLCVRFRNWPVFSAMVATFIVFVLKWKKKKLK